MDSYIWCLYNRETERFGEGKLVYQKRKNGLFYDSEIEQPLKPQPACYVEYMESIGRKVAKKYL